MTGPIGAKPRCTAGGTTVNLQMTKGKRLRRCTYIRRCEAPLRSRIDPEASCACREAR